MFVAIKITPHLTSVLYDTSSSDFILANRPCMHTKSKLYKMLQIQNFNTKYTTQGADLWMATTIYKWKDIYNKYNRGKKKKKCQCLTISQVWDLLLASHWTWPRIARLSFSKLKFQNLQIVNGQKFTVVIFNQRVLGMMRVYTTWSGQCCVAILQCKVCI